MKLRTIIGLPVFYAPTAEVLGTVQKVVFDNDFCISHLLIIAADNEELMIPSPCFTLNPDAVVINDRQSIKKRPLGEESKLYESKLGDVIYDATGKEIGSVSDFLVSSHEQRVWGIEVYTSLVNDILNGRSVVPLEKVNWKSRKSAVVAPERSRSS